MDIFLFGTTEYIYISLYIERLKIKLHCWIYFFYACYHRYCPGSETERFRGRGLIVLALALRSSSYSYSGHLTFSLPSFGSWTKYCHNNINRTICLWKIFDTHVFHIIYKNRMKTIIWNNDRELMLMYCSIQFNLFMYFMRKSPFNHLNQDKKLIRVVVKKKILFLLHFRPWTNIHSFWVACHQGWH